MNIRSTKVQLEEFEESLIWKDIVDELNDLLFGLSNEYDLVGEPNIETGQYPTTAETMIHLGDIKGRKKAIAYLLSLPNILIGKLEAQQQEDSNES